MIELNPERMTKAIEKAKRVRNHIRMIAWRKYEVRTPQGHTYIVIFDAQPGKKLASCNCAAGAKNQMCYHVAGAVVLHLAIARLRVAAEKRQAQKPVERKRAAILAKRECNHADCKTTRCDKGESYGGIAV